MMKGVARVCGIKMRLIFTLAIAQRPRMDRLLVHSASEAWTAQLKSDALFLTIVVLAVAGYIAAARGSYPRKRRTARKQVHFLKIVQVDSSTKVM